MNYDFAKKRSETISLTTKRMEAKSFVLRGAAQWASEEQDKIQFFGSEDPLAKEKFNEYKILAAELNKKANRLDAILARAIRL